MNPEIPDKEIVKKVLAEINLNEKELEEGVIHLRSWLAKQPHLPKSADDNTLRSFIVGSKSIERAKAKIDSYYTARIRFTSPFFENRDPTKIKWTDGQILYILPGLTPDNCKVVMYTLPYKQSVPDFDVEDLFRAVLMFYDMVIRRFYMCSGLYVISDMANISLELTLKGSISLSSQFAKIYQESYPIRLKGMINFNAPPIAETAYNTFVKPFFSQKLKERMFIHSADHKCLEKYIPLTMLPSDYEGGKSDPSNKLFEQTKEWLESMRTWFLKQGSEMPIEDFRPKPDNEEMKGTFRKLEAE